MLLTLIYNIVLLELKNYSYAIIKKQVIKQLNNAICLNYRINEMNRYLKWIYI
jgi:hypothetical protein